MTKQSTFLCIGINAWARSDTKEKAIANMKKNHPQGKEYIVYETDDLAISCDWIGNIALTEYGTYIKAIAKYDPKHLLPTLQEINDTLAIEFNKV